MSLAERYLNGRNLGKEAERFWFANDLMVGGSIVSQEDWDHLQRDFGITAVLSVESGMTDEEFGIDRLLYVPVHDDGLVKPITWFHGALHFSYRELSEDGGKLYVHDRMGTNRAGAMAYAILRTFHRLEAHQAYQRVREDLPTFGEGVAHTNYLTSAELAVATF